MQNQILISILISSFASSSLAAELPNWITHGATIDSSFHYVICSHDGLDPEDVKQIAESKCLASAAKLGGVVVKVNQKTVQSLTGADASEVTEIQPLEKQVKCEWTDRFLEKVGQGFRVWLQCRVKKTSIVKVSVPSKSKTTADPTLTNPISSSRQYKRAILTLAMAPQADRIVVIGDAGERIIEVTSNLTNVELHEGDLKIRVKKHLYKDSEFTLKQWKHGDKISKSVFFEKEI